MGYRFSVVPTNECSMFVEPNNRVQMIFCASKFGTVRGNVDTIAVIMFYINYLHLGRINVDSNMFLAAILTIAWMCFTKDL